MSDKHKHLSLDDRYSIQKALNEGQNFKAIGSMVGKDCSTISKEVKNHIDCEKLGAPYRAFNDCKHRIGCVYTQICNFQCKSRKSCSFCGKCINYCPEYEKEDCPLLLKPPYVCNGCKQRNKCTLEKHLYDALKANQEYEALRSESRSGFSLTELERQRLDSLISPLIKNGQSLHHILANNQDIIPICLKTAYSYADGGIFEARNIDMPRKVRFRPRKRKSTPLKVDKKCRIGRTYEDFKQYIADNPSLQVVELDSVEGIKGGAVLLTVYFRVSKLQLAFKREANDSKSVTDIFNQLYVDLGDELYRELFPVILADNGTEFSNPTAIEMAPDGSMRSRVFYCNPQAPNQKGACENNHEFIRRIIPKGKDIGQYGDDQIAKLVDHINSYGRPDLADKSPYDTFAFYHGQTALDKLGLKKVAPKDIILRPALFK